MEQDNFYDIPQQRRRINNTEGRNITLEVEFNIRGHKLWSFKKYIDFSLDFLGDYDFQEHYNFIKERFNEIKRIFIETQPLLLWTTCILTILHSIFRILAFEKDIKFWIRKKSLLCAGM